MFRIRLNPPPEIVFLNNIPEISFIETFQELDLEQFGSFINETGLLRQGNSGGSPVVRTGKKKPD